MYDNNQLIDSDTEYIIIKNELKKKGYYDTIILVIVYEKVGKIIGKTIWYLFEIVLILYVIAATSLLLCTNEFGFTQFGKTTVVVVDEDTIDRLSSYKRKRCFID